MNGRKSYDIVKGPNRDALFDALKYAHDEKAKIPIEFGVTYGYTMPQGHPGCAAFMMDTKDFTISSIEHEDGSGYSFNITGYCKASTDHVRREKWENYRFKAYYHAKRRSGWIEFA